MLVAGFQTYYARDRTCSRVDFARKNADKPGAEQARRQKMTFFAVKHVRKQKRQLLPRAFWALFQAVAMSSERSCLCSALDIFGRGCRVARRSYFSIQ